MGGTFRSLHFELLPAQESSLYLAGNTKNKDPTPGVFFISLLHHIPYLFPGLAVVEKTILRFSAFPGS